MEATIIYPHQLFIKSPALKPGRLVYLVEEPLILTYNPIHRQKLIFHKLTMDYYEKELQAQGYEIRRLVIDDLEKTSQVFSRLRDDGIDVMHIVDTTDDYLEDALARSDIERIWYESPMFILSRADAIQRYIKSKHNLAQFYKQLRVDKRVLLEDDKPAGGKWNFDEDNRKKLPSKLDLPTDIEFTDNTEVIAAISWSENVMAEVYGDAGCWLPYTHEAAQKFLEEFLCERFHDFGTYEDALTSRGIRLFHSTLSPLLNVGLLTPNEVMEAALNYAEENHVPINSLEGFVRQILGWREFIRASYEAEGRKMRSLNFWKHSRKLPKAMWTGTTNIDPLDISIKRALKYGYTHHIERLMVLGNFMLLTRRDPNEVYRWFMGMYVDAYDWVMVPNVYGMSQFADGGSFATKPYISGSNYLKKMSDYPSGEWEDTWTALYWSFIDTHSAFFKSNHRLSMMPSLLDKMDNTKRGQYLMAAQTFLHGFGEKQNPTKT